MFKTPSVLERKWSFFNYVKFYRLQNWISYVKCDGEKHVSFTMSWFFVWVHQVNLRFRFIVAPCIL